MTGSLPDGPPRPPRARAPVVRVTELNDRPSTAQVYRDYLDRFPDLVVSFEDPFDQDDWESFSDFTDEIGDQVQVVGDKLLATKEPRIVKAIEERACNALLLKVRVHGLVVTDTQQPRESPVLPSVCMLSSLSNLLPLR